MRLANDVDQALLLPQKAAFEVQDKNFVYVVDRNNKVQTRKFMPATRLSHFYLVDSGLKAGDKVVYEGVQNLREGMEIRPDFISMDSLLMATRH